MRYGGVVVTRPHCKTTKRVYYTHICIRIRRACVYMRNIHYSRATTIRVWWLYVEYYRILFHFYCLAKNKTYLEARGTPPSFFFLYFFCFQFFLQNIKYILGGTNAHIHTQSTITSSYYTQNSYSIHHMSTTPRQQWSTKKKIKTLNPNNSNSTHKTLHNIKNSDDDIACTRNRTLYRRHHHGRWG